MAVRLAPAPLIELDHLVAGGPPPDGIPPIDHPNFQPAHTVNWLEAAEPVTHLDTFWFAWVAFQPDTILHR